MTSAAGNHRQAQVSFGWWRQRATSPDGDPKDRRTAFSRFLLPLAFVAAAAVVVSAVIGYRLAVQLDEGQQVFQREQVLAAIEEYRGVLADITAHIAGDITIAFADGKPLADVAAKLKPMATSRYRFAQAFLVGEGQTVIAAYPEGAVVSEFDRANGRGVPRGRHASRRRRGRYFAIEPAQRDNRPRRAG